MKQQLDAQNKEEVAIADAILLSIAEQQLDEQRHAIQFWFNKYKEMFELVRDYYTNCECSEGVSYTCPNCKKYHSEAASHEAHQKSV